MKRLHKLFIKLFIEYATFTKNRNQKRQFPEKTWVEDLLLENFEY